MIELNKKTQQDFLNREWVQRLLDAGVNMDDAKYCIITINSTSKDYVLLNSQLLLREDWIDKYSYKAPTYTVSELLYKLHEWIYPEIDGVAYSGGLILTKDAPFYPAYYSLVKKDNPVKETEYIHSDFEYPIESFSSNATKKTLEWPILTQET